VKRIALAAVIASACAGGAGGKMDVENAGARAHEIAEASWSEFSILSEHEILPGKGPGSVTVTLEDGRCYRFVAVSASPGDSEVTLGIKHPEQVMEDGTDVYDLTPSDAARTEVAVRGLCVWPAIAGDVGVYHNLADSGGALVVLDAKASKLDWKSGEDVKLYLTGTGTLDPREVEKEDAESRLVAIAAMDREALPPHILGKTPFLNDMLGSKDTSWRTTFKIDEEACYHLFLASLNCTTKYTVVAGGKIIQKDAAPQDVGRPGWSQDFCPAKKLYGKEATLDVAMQMVTHEYDNCWTAVSITSFAPGKPVAKKIDTAAKKAGVKVEAGVKKCSKGLKSCKKKCAKSDDPGCKAECVKRHTGCLDAIEFPGEIRPE